MRDRVLMPLKNKLGEPFDRELLARLGFTLANVSPEEDLTETELPVGWTHTRMLNWQGFDILDTFNRCRGFMSLPTLDSVGHLELLSRYRISSSTHHVWYHYDINYSVLDFGVLPYGETHRGYPIMCQVCAHPPIEFRDGTPQRHSRYTQMDEQAYRSILDWLNENYPKWQDIEAYWNER